MSDQAGTGSAPTPDPAPSSGDTGQHNQGQRRNNNRGRDNRRRPVFKGMIDELKSNVFVCPQEDPEKTQDYRKVMEAVEAYVYRELVDADDMICALEGKPPEKLITPAFLDMKSLNEGEKIMRTEEIKERTKRQRSINLNLKKAYNILWSQCTPAMQSEIQGDPDYDTNSDASDCVWLVNKIKSVMMAFVEGESKYVSMMEAKMNLQIGKSNDAYYKDFTLRAEIIQQHNGTIGGDEGLVKDELELMSILTKPMMPVKVDNNTYAPALERYIKDMEAYHDEVRKRQEKAGKAAREKTLAILFISNSDKKRFGNLIARFKQSYVCGRDEYPRTINEAMRHLVREEALIPLSPSSNTGGRHRDRRGAGRGNDTNREGTPRTQAQLVQVSSRDPRDYELIFNQQGVERKPESNELVPGRYIICDSGSTHHGFKSKDLLSDLKETEEPLVSVSNGGWREATKKGNFKGIKDVWYDPGSLANIYHWVYSTNSFMCSTTMHSMMVFWFTEKKE